MTKESEDWISLYLKYTAESESPEKMHMWVGFALLAAALRRRVFLDRGTYKLYPNLYIVFVAESAKVRKSVCMETGIRLFEETAIDCPVFIGRSTPEGLIKNLNRVVKEENPADPLHPILKQESHVFIYADELATFFGYDKQAASRMTILLTQTYSAPAVYRHTTKGDGSLFVHNNYPVLLAGTDPRNLKVLPEDAIGGLIGRTIFVTAAKRRRAIAWPELASIEIKNKLMAHLFRVSHLAGEFKITNEARSFWANWYEKFSEISSDDPRLDAFHERAHDTALKIAMLLSVAENLDMIIDLKHVVGGIDIIEKQLPEFSRIAAWSLVSQYAQNRAKTIDIIRRFGGICDRRTIMKSLSLNSEEMSLIENSLGEEGTIIILAAGQNKRMYRLSPDEMAKYKDDIK
jgi:hypothetical protein